MNETTWQERVAAEAYELRGKIERLKAFMVNKEKVDGISEHAFRLLRSQRACMEELLDILDRRLELAGHEALRG